MENRFTRYLLYAIGEIVLVVIGILIALNVNNWNNQRKTRQELDGLVLNLKDNLRMQGNILKRQSDVLFIKDSLINLLVNSNNQPARLGDPQWLYLIFDSQGDIFASISELILDENMELILDRKSQFPEEYSEFMLNMKLFPELCEMNAHSWEAAPYPDLLPPHGLL